MKSSAPSLVTMPFWSSLAASEAAAPSRYSCMSSQDSPHETVAHASRRACSRGRLQSRITTSTIVPQDFTAEHYYQCGESRTLASAVRRQDHRRIAELGQAGHL